MRPQLSDLTNSQTEEDQTAAAAEYQKAMMCTRLAGRAIIRVVGRCNDAQENENLGKKLLCNLLIVHRNALNRRHHRN